MTASEIVQSGTEDAAHWAERDDRSEAEEYNPGDDLNEWGRPWRVAA